jgi:hypothetical protein
MQPGKPPSGPPAKISLSNKLEEERRNPVVPCESKTQPDHYTTRASFVTSPQSFSVIVIVPRRKKTGPQPPGCRLLLAQTKTINNLAVPYWVAAVKIVQQTPPLVHHHDQAASRCMVLHVGLEVRGQIADPLAQKRNLHFRRARILNMGPVLFDQH